ncbi:MAG: ribonuclease P protein component [Candidatus Levybacteria bacterium RIFCSPHIGHO2_01_FULL_40_15b]|nr:MAG: ribonuclease P protein component [Candidatus Levybacteria bacterium RIFCSPHIGHO2_01_FULL_40_15b]
MLAKKNRFSFRDSLPKNVFHSPSFTARYGKNVGELQVAVVVSKRVDKRATVRNKIKRKILNSIQKRLDTKESLDLIFYVKKNILNSGDLENEINQAVEKIKNF